MKKKYVRWLLSRKVICDLFPREKTKGKCRTILRDGRFVCTHSGWAALAYTAEHLRLSASHTYIMPNELQTRLWKFFYIFRCRLFLSWSDVVNARLISLNRLNKVLKIMEWNGIDCVMAYEMGVSRIWANVSNEKKPHRNGAIRKSTFGLTLQVSNSIRLSGFIK